MNPKTQIGRRGIVTVSRLVLAVGVAVGGASCTANTSDEADALFAGSRQCRDGIDNDGDGRVDYPADPGCSSKNDNSENTDNPQSPDASLPALAAPTTPTGFSAAAGDGKVSLTWNANPSAEQVDGYQVYRNGVAYNLSVPCCGFVDTAVVNGTAYDYRLSAHNATAYSAWTDPALSATPSGASSSTTVTTGTHDFPRTFMINSWKDVSELWKYDFVVSFNWMNVAGYKAQNPNGVAVSYVRLDTPAKVQANPTNCCGNMWETYWHESSLNVTYQEVSNPYLTTQRSISAEGWTGGTDTLTDGQAANVGYIRAFQSSDSQGPQAGCAANTVCDGWNVASSATADWLKRMIVYAAKVDHIYSAGWDGIWSDNVVCANSSKAACDNLASILSFERASLPGKNVGGNGAWEVRDMPGYPGNCCGGWLGSDPDGFKKMANMNLVEGLGYYNSDEDLFINWNRQVVNYADPYGRPRYNALADIGSGNSPSRVRYGLTLSMMADTYYMAQDGGWYDEYWGGSLNQRGYLGQPTGDPVKLASGVWRRDFEHGIALLNGSGGAKTVDLGGTFRKLTGTQDPTVNNGATVSSVSIPDNDGLILLR